MSLSIAPIDFNQEIGALLEAEGLPVSDLSCKSDEHQAAVLFCARYDQKILGVVGLEYHGASALLRSLAVAPVARSTGCGRLLVTFAEDRAVERGARSLYLLTTTAADYFARLGYGELSRSDAPREIAATPQFSDLCPSSAAFMCKRFNLSCP
ncbi:MAG: arsenic resistance N-acetyltransferase ArsN2 [Pseudomonadota bacterium]